MSNPFELVKQAAAPAKREFAGFKARLLFSSREFTTNIGIRYGKVEVEPLLDVEGQLEKVGPKGQPIRGAWEKHFYEGEEEITENEIRHLQVQEDGTKIEVSPLDRTGVIEVQDARAIEECTVDGEKSFGTTITREDVNKYATDSVYSIWGDDVWDEASLLRLAEEVLEKQKLALFFPFTFGRGFKIYTATAVPVRVNGDLYLMLLMNTGEMKLKHALRRAVEVKEERRVVLVAPRLRAKKPTGVA